MNVKKSFGINLKLLPFKVHYFFLFAACGGVLPYLPVLAKQLGISSSAVGITYSMLPLCSFVSKPLIGLATDYFRKLKVFILSIIVLSVLCVFSILFLPPISRGAQESIRIQVDFNNTTTILPLRYEKSCLEAQVIDEIKCFHKTESNNHSGASYDACILTISMDERLENSNHVSTNTSTDIQTTFSDTPHLVLNAQNQFEQGNTCTELFSNSSFDCQPNFQICLSSNNSEPSVYNTYQFWIFTLLAIISGASLSSAFSLTDVACYEVLGDQSEHYGRQRLWGTISYGIICPFSGFLSDLVSKNSEDRDFSPGFYLMLAFAVIDMFTLVKVSMVKTKFSANMYKDIKTIFRSGEIIVFAIGVYIVGALTSMIYTYELWYLQDMGASQTLLGLTVAMQCLIGEVPFLFFSGWFVKRFGHFLCISAAFAGFALRLGMYSFIRNPWLALPIDILHGLTFAIFYATMTSFASQRGPFGMEATMLGALGGMYDGLGACTGNFLGGIGLDKLGGRHTFLVASIVSLICVPIFVMVPSILDRISSTRKVKRASFQTPKSAWYF